VIGSRPTVLSGRSRCAGAILTALALLVPASRVEARPATPCAYDGRDISPLYGSVAASPSVETWHDIDLSLKETCSKAIRGQMKLAVAVAGRVESSKSLQELAARIGAISATEGLAYWSTSDGRWRTLVSNAFALRAPHAGARRPDFSAEEVLSGDTLYFAQAETRSTGVNIYSLSGRMRGPDKLVVEIANLTPIRFVVVTLFEPRSLLSVHFIEAVAGGDWGYYGLSAVRGGAVEGHDASFINRAAAYYRFLRGVPGDVEPPLVR